MEQNVAHLDWDTNFFGFGVARIMQADLDDAELSQILGILRSRSYRLVYWQIPASRSQLSLMAQARGGFLADEKITYVKELVEASGPRYAATYTINPYSSSVPDEAMIKLALQSAEHSRFRHDPIISQDLCDKLFTYWVTRSVSKEIAWEVLVASEQNELLGFITLGEKGVRADIGLVAVADFVRGKGIGKALVTNAGKKFLEKGYAHVQVVTQKRNLGACGLYSSCGYKIESVENVFHFWL